MCKLVCLWPRAQWKWQLGNAHHQPIDQLREVYVRAHAIGPEDGELCLRRTNSPTLPLCPSLPLYFTSVLFPSPVMPPPLRTLFPACVILSPFLCAPFHSSNPCVRARRLKWKKKRNVRVCGIFWNNMLLKSGRERQKISYNICTCCLFILLRAWFQNGFWHIFCYFQTNLNTKVHHSELVLISASLQCEDYRTNMHPRWLGRERYCKHCGALYRTSSTV